jgi:uncharacterized protein YneF (UPF0154 family)
MNDIIFLLLAIAVFAIVAATILGEIILKKVTDDESDEHDPYNEIEIKEF